MFSPKTTTTMFQDIKLSIQLNHNNALVSKLMTKINLNNLGQQNKYIIMVIEYIHLVISRNNNNKVILL